MTNKQKNEKFEKVEKLENKTKAISCYLNEQLKLALEREAIYYKSLGDTERDSINKNMIFIMNLFIDEYSQNISGLGDRFTEVIAKDISSINPKDISRTLKVVSKAYPLKFTPEFSKKFEDFRVDVNSNFKIIITKMNLYNFILLDYYIKNKIQIAKKDLVFWMQDYFSRSTSMIDFKDILKMFNEWAEKESEHEKNK